MYQSSSAWSGDKEHPLRRALEEKADKYGKLQYPYVIAVDILALKALGCDIEEVLFGKEVIVFDKQSQETKLTRAPYLPDRPSEENGFWSARRRSRNERVSAVLLIDELMPWSAAHRTPVLWHNPWAEKPLNPDIWQGPQMILDMSEAQMRYREGKKGWEILHLIPYELNNDTQTL